MSKSFTLHHLFNKDFLLYIKYSRVYLTRKIILKYRKKTLKIKLTN